MHPTRGALEAGRRDPAAVASCLSAVGAFLLPLIILGVGWVNWGFKVGLISALAVLATCLGSLVFFVRRIERVTWLTVAMPYLGSMLYTAMPDLPFTFDDTAVAVVGALLTYYLLKQKVWNAPRWILTPLLLPAVYTLTVGQAIPTPVDDLIVQGITGILVAFFTAVSS